MKFHYHLLINQAAGSGNGQKVGERILALLEKNHFLYTAYYTEYAGQEREIAASLAATVLCHFDEVESLEVFPLLVVIGGDGTLHQILNQFFLQEQQFPVGYIPAGSGNDFARGIGLSREPEKAFWQIAKTDRPQMVNVLLYDEKIQVEQGLVLNNVGIGLDAAIVAATNDSQTKKVLNKYNLGSLSYILSILRVLFTQKGFPVLIEANGNTYNFDKAFLCTTTNHPYFGGGVAIAPMADPFKDNLDLVLVERVAMFKLFWLIGKLIRQTHPESRYFHHIVAKKLRIVSTVPQYGQADGEVMGKRPFDITFTTGCQAIWF